MTTPAYPLARARAGVLALEQVDELAFEGVAHGGPSHQIYGGQVVAHALLAATRTVEGGRAVHSLHSQFVDRGDPRVPIRYDVVKVRDGRTFATRQVTASQRERVLFTQSCSFQEESTGPAHQLPSFGSPLDPGSLPTTEDRVRPLDDRTREWWRLVGSMFPLEIRFLDEPARARSARGERVPPRERFYVRLRGRIHEGAGDGAAALAYLSDLFLLSASVLPHGLLVGPQVTVTSLDHSIWFHRQVSAGAWLLHDIESSWAGGGRALARGHLFAADGGLVATTMQEGLIRVVR